MDAVLTKHQICAESEPLSQSVNKWDVLRELSAARVTYGLSDRDMSVLQALISFHPSTTLQNDDGSPVVYPSNRTICERLNGMPSSTMRRHLARLVELGIIIRRDSPNGKRYARVYSGNKIAYGFDLTPLLIRYQEFCDAACRVRETAEEIKSKREAVFLMRRDLMGLTRYGSTQLPNQEIWAHATLAIEKSVKLLRRKLDLEELDELASEMTALIGDLQTVISTVNTEEVSTSAAQNEHHYQNSKTEIFDNENAAGSLDVPLNPSCRNPKFSFSSEHNNRNRNQADIELADILNVCSEIQNYIPESITSWRGFISAAEMVRPMMGINTSVWMVAKEHMGLAQASVVVAAMLERFQTIRSPGAYLRSLAKKAGEGRFSYRPMVLALSEGRL